MKSTKWKRIVAVCAAWTAIYVTIELAKDAIAQSSGITYNRDAGNDRSDAWTAPGEVGWGVMMAQQQDVIFMALFVYGADRKPTWYTAAVKYDALSDTYSGALNVTSGPPHTGPYDASTVTLTPVGTATLSYVDDNRFALTYTVDGVPVSKIIQRVTWAQSDLTGSYFGGLSGYTSNCTVPWMNGYSSKLADFSVTHAGNQLTLTGSFQNDRGGTVACAFAGLYSQAGRMGEASGAYSCSSGESGTFTFSRIEATANGILGMANTLSNFCSFTGSFGGLRRN